MQSITSRLERASPRPWPDAPVRLTFVITDLDVGGAEKALTTLVQRLDRTRWHPSVLCMDGEGRLAGMLRDSDIEVHCLGVDRRRPVQAVMRLSSEISRLRPALIQSFLFHANLATKLAAPWRGRPWIVGGIRVSEREKRWHLTLDRWTQGLSAGSVCVSRDVMDFTSREGGISAERLVMIPNGVDVPSRGEALADSEGLGLPVGPRILLFVGRIAPQKGVGNLIEAFKRVAGKYQDWKLVIVGDGPLRTDLEAASRVEPLLQGRVIWLGWRGDARDLMSGADMLVLPSLWEGMPNVVLEAMASSLPVLSTPVEGVRDLIVPDGPEATGWIARGFEVDPLASALDRALGDCDRFESLGRRGRRRVETHFGWARVVRDYERLWAGLLGLERAETEEDRVLAGPPGDGRP